MVRIKARDLAGLTNKMQHDMGEGQRTGRPQQECFKLTSEIRSNDTTFCVSYVSLLIHGEA